MATESPREAFAYIAGYMDGEACIGYWTGRVEVKIDTCTPHALHFMSKHFGGNVKKTAAKTKSGRSVWRLHYSNGPAIKLLNHTLEFLHEKKKQAEMVLQMHDLACAMRVDKKTNHKK